MLARVCKGVVSSFKRSRLKKNSRASCTPEAPFKSSLTRPCKYHKMNILLLTGWVSVSSSSRFSSSPSTTMGSRCCSFPSTIGSTPSRPSWASSHSLNCWIVSSSSGVHYSWTIKSESRKLPKIIENYIE